MKILQVKQYNDYDMAKYNQRVAEWQKESRFSHNIIPQIAFVGFRLPNGEMRKKGYVVFGEDNAYFYKNKKEAIINFEAKAIFN
jgi:hypothetical protein